MVPFFSTWILRQLEVEERPGHLLLVAHPVHHHRVRRQFQVLAADEDDVVLRHVVAGGPDEALGHHVGVGLRLGELGHVELEDVLLAAGVLDDEADRDATDLRALDGERQVLLRGALHIGAAADLVRRQVAHADPVGEPGRVGHLVHRVDVGGPPVRPHLHPAGEPLLEVDVVPDERRKYFRSAGFFGTSRRSLTTWTGGRLWKRSSPAGGRARSRPGGVRGSGQDAHQSRSTRAVGS